MNTSKARITLASLAAVGLTATGPASAAVHASTPRNGVAASSGGVCIPSLIDDFSTGSYRSPDLRNGHADATRTGSMLGGRRATRFVSAPNEYRLPATMLVAPNHKPALIVSSGYLGFSQLWVSYGVRGAGQLAPLNADLSCYDRFRVHFAAADLPLNINVEVQSASSPSVYQCGVNTVADQLNGFYVDFKFSCFVTNDPAHPPVDWADIDRILLLIQNASQVAANDYAISSMELVG